jgi:regulator of protease activity HflC (stomatin/prohibitin superfamily)
MRVRIRKFVYCVGETDRLVVFRLGRMQGVLGPGRVVTFPWIDSYKRVNVGASAFR